MSSALEEAEITLLAANAARYLFVAGCTIVVYDYLLTVDEEIEYFWFAPWSTSKSLYFANRCLPPCTLILTLAAFFIPHPSNQMCNRIIQADYSLGIASTIVIQAILVLRTWYIFPRNIVARSLAVASFFASIVTTVVLLYLSMEDIHAVEEIHDIGCAAPVPNGVWRMFVVIFTFHTFLFLFTVFRAVIARSRHSAPLLHRLIRDGGIFYMVIFFSVGFTGIGAFFMHDPGINIPAVNSNFMIAINSVCAARIMLSIRSLAANLATDPVWLLNNVEMSRINLQRGAYDAELLVDVNAVEGVDANPDRETTGELPSGPLSQRNVQSLISVVHAPFHSEKITHNA